jgi:hypothetical protein
MKKQKKEKKDYKRNYSHKEALPIAALLFKGIKVRQEAKA